MLEPLLLVEEDDRVAPVDARRALAEDAGGEDVAPEPATSVREELAQIMKRLRIQNVQGRVRYAIHVGLVSCEP
ncbi:MAG: hypothetical protein JOZ69_12505 [Myxococcales bacterium]|nr:hypothetical protein [Myxococcales bacterium]